MTAVVLAAAIAFPVSVAGQAEELPDTSLEHAHVLSLRTCLQHGICAESEQGLDRRILFTVRGWDSHAARIVFGGADATAYPMFVAAPVVLWGGVLADELSRDDAVAGSVALMAGTGATMILKRIVGRKRPYAAIDGFSARSGHAGVAGLSDSASFPSGHATLAGIVATGAAVLIRRPVATAAAGTWALAVSTSRMWLGVHYPSDVAAGLPVGTGSTLLIMAVVGAL